MRRSLGVIAICLISSTAFAADWYGPTAGGYGGGPKKLVCPPHAIMVGVSGRLGAYIDRLQIVCRDLREVRDPDGSVRIQTPGPPYDAGGHMGYSTGGQPYSQRLCSNDPYPRPAGARIAAINFVDYGRSQALNFITMQCAELWQGHSTHHNAGMGTADGIRPFWLQCPQGLWLRGVYGRSGQFVDQLGPVCGPLDPYRL
jgi:hypothetical protein